MSMEKLRTSLLQIEARAKEERQTQNSGTRVPAANTAQSGNKDRVKCKRCYKYNHEDDGKGSCPLWKDSLYFCLVCNQNVPHKGKYECPKSPLYRLENSKYFYNSQNSENGRSRSNRGGNGGKMTRRDGNTVDRRN